MKLKELLTVIFERKIILYEGETSEDLYFGNPRDVPENLANRTVTAVGENSGYLDVEISQEVGECQ